MLPFIVIGLTSGAVYALAGLGLVLTYKTSRVFNFALGALATVGAYVFYVLYVLNDWSWVTAAFVVICVAGPIMGLILEVLARRIQTTSLALRVASTVGLLLVIVAGIQLIYGNEQVREVPIFLGTKNLRILGTNVQLTQLVTFLFALAATGVLTVFFRCSRSGVSMRAVVDNPDLLDMAGTSLVKTRRLAWVIGTVLVAASGVLFAPVEQLDPVQLTLLVVSAFGAAAIGGFGRMPLTLFGGLFIGVISALCTKWFTSGFLSTASVAMPYIILLGVLLAFPRRYLVGKSFTVPRARPTWRAPGSLQLLGGFVLVVFLCFVPGFAGIHLTDWTTFLAMTIVFMSLGLLVRTSGQVSLCQVSFIAIGACAFSHFTVGSHIPWFLALVLCGLVAVPIGAILAIPAIRLTGLYLAIATFAFGFLLQTMFYTEGYMFGSNGMVRAMPRPSIATSDKSFYFLCLASAIGAAICVVALNRTRLGRLLRGQADSPVAFETLGNSVRVTRVMVFCISAFMAAVGGALAGVASSTISADSFQPIQSLTYFALIIIVVGGEPWDALLAAAGLFLIPSYITGSTVGTWLQLLFGVGAILYAITPSEKQGMPAPVQCFLDQTFGRIKIAIPHALRRPGRAPPAPPDMSGGLLIENMTVRFGGVLAVDGITLRATEGRATALIGPNGAGKTTTFNAITGLIKPASGKITIAGVDVAHRHISARARMGLGRTFQKMELFDTLTVRDNVEAGAEAAHAGSNPITHFLSKPGQRAQIRANAQQAMELCEIEPVADTPASALSTGQRRLVELARCLAGPFGLLLLDEPSTGLDRAETQKIGEILKRAVNERGVGILLVEHDMSLVLDICDHIYVLDFGELILEGTAHEIVSSPIVQAAYLGDSTVEQVVEEAGKRVEGARVNPKGPSASHDPSDGGMTEIAPLKAAPAAETARRDGVLVLSALTAGYRGTTVLRNVDLAVPAGQVVALLGPNGAGKTTLLRAAAGLLGVSSGRVTLHGQDVTYHQPFQRNRHGLSLIPEGRGIFPNLTVRENLLLQIPPWHDSGNFEPALELFPILKERLGQTAGSLSGGQQQLLALSRCFLSHPHVVLLDEVTMGLAPRIIDEIFHTVHSLAQAGIAVLLVEQYVGRALDAADRIYLLNRGQITFSGRPSEIDEEQLTRNYIGDRREARSDRGASHNLFPSRATEAGS